MKTLFKRLLKRPRKLVVTFTEMPGGKMETSVKIDKELPVLNVLNAVEHIKFDLQTKLTNKAQANGFTHKNPKTRPFLNKQKVGDVL